MSKARKRGIVRLIGVARRTRSALMVSTALQAVVVMVLAVPADAQPAPNARPTGGVVVGGTVAIAQTANATTINQSSQRAAVNWQSFNVGAQQSVTFQQPNANAIALNTVTGPNPSQIAGRISANGQVVLVNQSGVTFYKGSQVNTAGLMVSAIGTDQKAFMAGGNIVFDKPGNPNARIINNGNITITGAGLAGLVAPSVANAGVINAKLGHVVLAGARTATLDLYGDKLVSLNVTGAVTQAPNGGDALVTNTGVIRADGGTVQLTARAVDGVVTNLVTAGGKIQARTVGGQQGQVSIDGVGGSITITGKLDATGRAAGTTGGRIQLLASNQVIVKSGAVVNASGAAGGTIAIGTTLKRATGGPSVTGERTAKSVIIQQGATIAANATTLGNGGKATVLASGTTTMAGLITAKGGPTGGDGGSVEVSGGVLKLTGMVDTTAPSGLTGTLLLDPSDLYVSDTEPAAAKHTISKGDLPTVDANNAPNANTVSWVSPAVLAAQKSDISLAATDNLFVASSAGTANTLDIGSNNLTLIAGTNLTIDRGFTIDAGNISLTANAGSITLGGSSGVTAGLITSAEIGGLAPTSVRATNLTATATGIALGDATLGTTKSPLTTIDLSATSTGGVTQAAAGSVIAGTLVSTSNVAGAVVLTGIANAIASIGSFAATGEGNGITLTTASALAVTGVVSTAAGDAVLTSTGKNSGITIGAAGKVTVPTVNVASFRADTFANAGTVTGGTFAYAPNTPGLLTLGTGGNIVDLTGVGTGSIRFGSVAGSITATGITIASDFDIGVGNSFTARPLDLQATGAVTDGGIHPLINVTTLTGAVSGGSVSFTSVSSGIANIGSFTVSGAGNGFTLKQNSGTLSVTGALAASSVTLASANLAIPGSISTGGTSTGSVSLTVNTGTIGGDGTITTGSLTGHAASTVNLSGPNQIGTVDSFSAAGFTLNDAIGLTVANSLSAAAVSLTAPSIAIPGLLTDGGAGTVSLVATTGSISESGTFIAGTLSGSSAGSAILTGASAAANQIANLGPFTAEAGTIVVSDGTSLIVSGVVTAAAGDVVLRSAGTNNSISILDSGALAAPVGTVSVRADAFSNAGTVTGNVFEYAQDTTGALTVGTNGAIVDLTGIGSGLIRLGSAAGTITANSITLSSNLDLIDVNQARPLDLQANGDISDGGSRLFNVSTLTGVANGGSVTLNDLANTVTSVGTFTAGGAFTLGDSLDLSVTGVLSAAGPVMLTAASIDIPGSITTGGSAAGSVALISKSTTIGGTGAIATGTLTANATTSIDLSGANQIGTVGSLTGTAINLNDGVALTINDNVSAAGAVSLTSAGLLSLASGQTVTGSGITLTGGDLAISGRVTTAGTLDLIASLGSISETGTIDAGTLIGSAATSAILNGASASANKISNLGAFTATAGTLSVSDGIALTVSDNLSAPAGDVVLHSTGSGISVLAGVTLASAASTGTISIRADALTLGGTTTGGVFEYAADSPGLLKIGTGGAIADLTGIGSSLIRLGSAEGSITANGISVTSDLDLTSHGLDLRSNNGIDDGGNSLLNVSTLSGLANSGSVVLGSILNTVTALGSFAVAGGFTIADSIDLAIANTLSAGAVSLTAPNLTIAGTITTGGSAVGSTALIANVGTIGETGAGAIVTGTLTGSVIGAVILAGTNQIGTLGSFTAASVALNDASALTIANTVSAAGSVALSSGGLLTVGSGQTVTGSTISLSGSSLALNGEVTDGGAGTVSLIATNGSITESGTLIAGTLSGSAFASANLTGTNNVVNLGSFGAAGFTMNDGAALTVTGTVAGGTVVSIIDSGLLTNTGKISGTAISLTADSLALGGVVTDGGSGTVHLIANTGTIDQTGTLIAGTLSGTAPGTITVSGASAAANQIGTLGALSGLGILVNDGTAVAVAGTVNGGAGTVALNSTGLLSVSGTVTAAAVALTGDTLSIGGLVDASTVRLTAAVGGMTESGTLIAGTLTGSSAGSASLLGANAIAALGPFTVTAGSFALNNGTPLTVSGTVDGFGGVTITGSGPLTIASTITSAAGGVALGSTDPGGVTIAGGRVIATGNIVSVSAPAMLIGLLGTISTGTFEYGPGVAGGTVTLGGAGLTAGRIGAANIRIGKVNGTVVAGGIVIAGFDNAGRPLELDTTGTVTETGALTGVSSLTGLAGAFELSSLINSIGTLGGGGSLIATGGLAVRNGVDMTLAGLVSAGTVDLSTAFGANITQAAGATLLAGVLTSANGITGSAILTGTANQIGTVTNLAAGGLTLVDSKALTLTGVVNVGTLDASGVSVTQAAAGKLIAGVVISATGLSGGLILQGASNQIGTIAGLTAAGITVVDSASLTLAGNVSAGSAGTADITTVNGSSLSQSASGTLITGLLKSAGGIAGNAILQGTANQIGTIGGLTVTGGLLTVVDDHALTLAGAVTAGAVNISSTAGVTQAASATLTTGVLTSTGGISGNLNLLGTLNQIGTISGLTAAGIKLTNSQALTLAGTVSAGTAGTLDISTTGTTGGGSLTQGTTATLIAGDLTSTNGIAGNAILRGTANQIGTISDLTVSGGTLTVVNSQALGLAGTVNAGSGGTVDLSALSVTQSGGTLTTGVLTSSGGVSGAAAFASASNKIGTLRDFNADNSIIVADSQALTLAGSINTGTIGITTVGAGSNLTQAAGATLAAGVLTGGGIAGTAFLRGTANAIDAISGFVATGSLAVVDGKAMTVIGTVGANTGNVFLTTGTSALTFAAGGSVISQPGGTVGIQAGGIVNLGTAGATGVVNAGTAGLFELAPAGPATITLGATSGLSLVDTTGITAGLLRLGAVTLPGDSLATRFAAAIAIAGPFDAGGRSLELDAIGAVTQSAPLLNVARLSGQAASYALTDPGNTISQLAGSIGPFPGFALAASAGTIAVVDAAALTIAGTVSAPAGNVFLSTGTNAMTFGPGGTAISQPAGTIGLRAGSLVNLGTAGATGLAQTTGGLFELAPGGSGAILTLGSSAGLFLSDLTGIGASTLRFGAITLPGSSTPTTTAGSITLSGTFDAKGLPVELDATGAVSDSGAASLRNVSVLTGTAGSYDLLSAGNTIAQVGGGTLTSTIGDLSILDNGSMAIAGTVRSNANVSLSVTSGNAIIFAPAAEVIARSGDQVMLTADSIVNLGTTGATGLVNSGIGSFVLRPASAIAVTIGANSGLSLTNLTGIESAFVVIGGSLASSIAIAGTFDAGGRPLELDSAGGVTQTAPLINVSTLTGTAASYMLTNAGNTIGQIGGGTLHATAGTIAIADNAPLMIAGTVDAAAGNVWLQTSAGHALTFAAGGTVASKASGTVGIQADSVVNLGTAGSTGAVNAGAAGTFELAPTSKITLTLGSAAGLSLTNLNRITAGVARIGEVTLPGGLAPTVTAGSIAVAGTFNAGSLGTLDLEALGSISQTAGAPIVNLVTLLAGTNGLAGDINLGNTLNAIGTLGNIGVTSGNFVFGDTPASGTFATRPGQTISARNVSMTIVGTLAVNPTSSITGTVSNVSLATNGAAADMIVAGRVTSSGTTTLTSGRDIVIQNGTVLGSAATLSAAGLISDGGLVSAAAVSLTGANIGILGELTDGGAGTVSLIATAGTIHTTGVLIAGTLSGGSSGSTTLSGLTATSNQIAMIGDFSAAGLTLRDGESLTVAGVLNGGTGSATIADSGAIVAAGTILAAAVSLTGTSIAIPGLVSDGGKGSVSLIATAGTINETGTLIAGTLSGSSTGATTLTGASATTNRIATLGGFTAAGFTMNDGADLSIAGSLNAGAAATITGSGLISVAGTVSGTSVQLMGASIAIPGTVAANTVLLTGANITIPGLVTDGGKGTVGLFATNGTIDEAGTLIAGTLFGSSTGPTTLAGATNQVATIGTFTAASFLLNDDESLSVAGTLNGGTAVKIVDRAQLSIGGTVTAAAIDMSGVDIAIPGLVNAGAAGAISLSAPGGTIDETGTLIAGTLSSVSTLATLTGATPTTNQIATTANIVSNGFTLNDGISLAVIEPMFGGTAVAIVDSASLSVASFITATAISLIAANMTILGTVTDGGAGTVNLIATGGLITEIGTLIVGTLTGSSTGATTLTGASSSTNQIATLGSFTAAGFTLNDGTSLTVAGIVNGGSAATITDSATLTIAGAVSAGAISLTAANIAIPGLVTDGGAGTVSLIATAGTIDETGTLIAGTLSGHASGAATLTGATPTTNQIATFSGFSAAEFTLNNGAALSLGGMVNGGTSGTIITTGPLTIGGTVSAAAVSLTGAGIAITGLVSDGGAGTVYLLATGGTISESGTLIAGTLTGSSTGATSLTGATETTNQVATLGTFTAAGFTLNDGKTLAVTGAVNGGTAAAITDSALLAIGGTISATAVSLTGASILIPGLVTDGGAGSVGLIATGDFISESGTLIGGTLTGRSAGATTLTGATPTANQIATLGSFTAAGFTLRDGEDLSVAGIVNGGTAASITESGALAIGGTISATAIGLQAANLSIPGLVTDGGTGTVNLTATAGAITETGTLIAGTLSGGSSGATTLTGTTPATNQIATVSSFAAAGFTLNDGEALLVSGTLNGGPAATITGGALLVIGGTVGANVVNLTASSISIPGLVSDGGSGTVHLVATAGDIGETGAIIAGTLSGGSTGATTLTGATPATNQIATLGAFTASGFTVNDGASLTVAGVLSGGPSATIADNAFLSIAGTVSATAVSLTSATIAIPGEVTDGGAGSVALNATSGPITETGTLIAGTLSGGAAGAATFTGSTATTNQVAVVTRFFAQGLVLNDGVGLAVSGPISAGGTFALNETGNLSIAAPASVAAGAITINDRGNATISGILNSAGTAAITVSGSLGVDGAINAGDGVTIAAGGDMTLTGTIGSAAGAVGITDGGVLSIPGLVVGQAGVIVTDSGSTTIAGNLVSTGGIVGINQSGSLNVTGAIRGQNGVTQTATGDMSLSGVLTSPNGFVTISDGGVLSLAGTSNIAAATSITVSDAGAIGLAGALSAPRIVLNNGAGTTTVANGTRVQTSGTARPNGTLQTLQLPTSTTSSGFFITTGQFIQNGSLTVSGSPNVMRIDASTGITLTPSPGGIVAPNTWLILNLTNGAKATGGVDVLNLDAAFTGDGVGTTLTGTVGGLNGNAAAGASGIVPITNSNFKINGCAISSVNCVLLTTQGIPTGNPLTNFVIGSMSDPTDEDDLLLPLVSDEVY